MKSLALSLACVLFCQYTAPPVRAQGLPNALNIVVVEGEGAIDNAHQHVTHEPIIRVEDENHKPVAGAAVVFTLPTEGTTGVFANGSQNLIVNTDSNGVAVGKGLKVNQVSGKLVIHVSASYRSLTARTTINQQNEGVAGAKASTGGTHSGRTILIVALVAAAAGGGAYFATHQSSNSSTSTTTTTTTTTTAIGLTPGSGVIIGPH